MFSNFSNFRSECFQTLEPSVWAYGYEMARILVSKLNGKNQTTRCELAEKQAH